MKKAAFLAAWVFFALTAASAQQKEVLAGNGKLNKQKREVPSYTNLSVSGPFNVRLIYSDTGILTFEGDENILSLITAKVESGTLHIGTVDNQPVKASRNNTIDIKVPYRQMNAIRLTGSGYVYAARTLRESNLVLELEGSGSIRMSADVEKLKAVVLGPGSIFIEGNADSFDCAIAGSGTIMACELMTKDVKAVVSGCGNIQTNSTKKLTGRIDGTGTIAFSGEPSDTDFKLSGNGKFSLLDGKE